MADVIRAIEVDPLTAVVWSLMADVAISPATIRAYFEGSPHAESTARLFRAAAPRDGNRCGRVLKFVKR